MKNSFKLSLRIVSVILIMCLLTTSYPQLITLASEAVFSNDEQFDYPPSIEYSEEEADNSFPDENNFVSDNSSLDEKTDESEESGEQNKVSDDILLNSPEIADSVDSFEKKYGNPISVSQFEKTFKTDSNSYVTILSSTPNTYTDNRGNEKKIDNTLIKKSSVLSGYYYQNKANSYIVKLPEEMSYDSGVEYISDGLNVELIPLEGDYTQAVVSENAILYNNVFADIDVQYSIFETYVKEYVVLNKQTKKNTFTYELVAKNTSVEMVDGVIAVTKYGDTKPCMYITAPEMFDAKGETSNNVTLELKRVFGRYYITLTADAEWLSAAERCYPVKIDPTVEIPYYAIDVCTFTERKGLYEGGGYSYAGDMNSTATGVAGANFGQAQIYYQPNFDLSSIPKEAKIDSAQLSIYQTSNPYNTKGIDKSMSFSCYMLKKQADRGMSWAQFTSLDSEVAGENAVSYYNPKNYHYFDIKSAVNYWVQGVYPNYGLIVKSNDPTKTAPCFQTSYVPATGNFNPDHAPCIIINWSVPDPVDVNLSVNSTSIAVRPIVETNTKGKLNVLGISFDGIAKPGSVINYNLNDTSKNFSGNTISSYSYKYPDTSSFESAFPANATKYRDKLSNWQNIIPFVEFEYDKVYYLNASANYNGETGSNAESDRFLIYKIKQFDTLPKIASYYGVPLETIMFDNRVQDMLLVENNTLFIRNPVVAEPYNPDTLSEQDKIKIDSLLMGRGLHCEFGYEPINLNTGNFILESEDYSIPDYDGNFSLTRTYNSKGSAYNSIFGRGWSFEYSQYLSAKENGDIIYNRGDGSSIYFTKNGDKYLCPDGYYLSLRRVVVNNKTVDLGAGEETYAVYEYEISDTSNTVYRFNCYGSLIKVTNARGRTVTLEYDENQCISKLISPAGHTFIFTSDARGRVAQITLPSGCSISYTYDENNNLISSKDAMGFETKYIYDNLHRMTSWADANGNTVVSNVYDSENRVVKQTDGEGNVTKLTYSDGKTKVTDADGYSITYYYDNLYRTIKIVYDDSTYIENGYDENNNLAWTKDELGHTTHYSYDSNGNVTKATRFDGAVSSYKYNSLNLVTEFVDFDGSVQKYTYDSYGNLTSLTDNAGNVLRYTYDSLHRLVSFTDANGNTSAMSYSGAFMTSASDSQGNAIAYSYNRDGLLTAATQPDGGTYRYMYDNNRRKIGEQSPEGEYTKYIYDNAGSVKAIVDPNGNTSYFTYDSLGNILTGSDPMGGTLTYTYDGRGNVLSEKDADGHKTTYTYDCKSNRLTEKDGDGYTKRYNYDSIGNLIAMTDGNGNKTTYSYDYRFNGISSVTDALDNVTKYTYSNSGNVIGVTNPDGTKETYSYDKLDRLVESISVNGLKTSYDYDKNGNLLKVSDNSGCTLSYTYNSLNLLTSSVDANGNSTTYSYDSRQRLTAIKDNLNGVTNYSYDKSNRMTSVKDANGNKVSYKFDANGNITEETDGRGNTSKIAYNKVDKASIVIDANGNQTQMLYTGSENLSKVNDALGNSVQYKYNGRGLPTSTTDALGNVSKFSYDGNGNITSVVLADGNTTKYSYDSLNRVIKTVEESGKETIYTYDSMSNVLSETDNAGNNFKYSYDKAGNLIKATNALGQTSEYEYDLRGNVISEKAYDGTTAKYTYDRNNNLITSTDAENHITTYTYDKLNRLIKTEDDSNRVWTYEYDATGRLTKYTNPLGESESYFYDGADNLVKMIDSAGNSVSYVYDAAGNLISQKDKNGNDTKLGYDALNRVISCTNADGSKQEYLYDANSKLIKEKDGLGNVTEYEYDCVGNLVSQKTPNGGLYSYTYDAQYNNTSYTDPLGNQTSMSYDLDGNLTEKVLANGGKYKYIYDELSRITKVTDPIGQSLSFTYDSHNNIVSQKDNTGRTTKYSYDVMHRLTKMVDAAGYVTSYSYDVNGNLANVVTPSGGKTTYSYDVLDRVISVTDAVGQTSNVSYDVVGNIDSITNSGGRVTMFAYDPNGNLTSTTNAIGETSTNSYDKMNRLIKETDAAGKTTTYRYNAAGQVMSITAANGGKVNFSYDGNGNLTSISDAESRLISYTYDLNDQLIAVSQGDSETKYSYDSVGNVVFVTNGDGNTTEYVYDLASNLVSTKNPLGEVTKYTYNKNGNLSKIKQADGSSISYDYDALDNLVSKEYSQNSTPSVAYGYDEEGRCISMEDFGGTNTYEYDALGRATCVTTAGGQTVSYEYDDCGNISKLTYPDGTSVRYEYDLLCRLTKVIDRNGGETTYSYDKSGNVVSVLRPNGTKSEITYTSINSVEKVTNYDANGKVVSKYSYEYDYSGSIIKETSTVEGDKTVREFEYDASNQLISEKITSGLSTTKVTYSYDNSGNRTKVETKKGGKTTTVEYEYDNADRIVRTVDSENGTTEYTYDKNGNRISKTDSKGDKLTYEYDTENRLRAVSDNGTLLMAALYDGNGERVFTVNRSTDTYSEKVSQPGTNNTTVGTGDTNDTYSISDVSANGLPQGTIDVYAYDDQVYADPANTIFWYGFGQGLINRCTVSTAYLSDWFNDAWKFISGRFDTFTRRLGELGFEGFIEGDSSRNNNDTSNSPESVQDQMYLYQTMLIPYGIGDKAVEDYEMLLYVNDINTDYTEALMTYGTDGNINTVYTYGNERLISEQYGKSSYYSYNGRGDVAGLTTENGILGISYAYDAYGNVTATGASDNPYNYNAEAVDPSTGLQYLRARYYDSGIGGFITQDTYRGDIIDPLTLNLYTYTGNNPLNLIDPSGHGWFSNAWNSVKEGAKAVGNFVKENAMTIATTVATTAAAVALTIAAPAVAAVVLTTVAVVAIGASTVKNVQNYRNTAKKIDKLNEEIVNGSNAKVEYVSKAPTKLYQDSVHGYQYYNKQQKKVITFKNEAEYLQYKANCEGKERAKTEMWKGLGHDALDGLGMIPGYGAIADAANGVWYAAEGDYGNATLSFVSTVVEGTTSIKQAKNATKAADVISSTDEIVDIVQDSSSILKNTDEIAEVVQNTGKNSDNIAEGASSTKKAIESGKTTNPYAYLEDGPNVGEGKNFTAAQKQKMLEENMKRNGGVVKSDNPNDYFETLTKPQKSQKGVTPSPDEWQFDHIIPKDKGGTNSYSNCQIVSRKFNREKWNN